MIKTFISIIALVLLVGCASSVSEPAPANTSAPTNLPTSTPTPTPEPTPTPVPLEGRLFFDMNGSGLKDEASFNYDAERLTDERQPLQADLLAAIEAYVAGHPELIDGDLITLEEPGLSGYTVCAKSNCVTTDAEGKFQLVEPDVDRFLNISIKDPNAGTPALEMRYVNKWKGEVTVPEYTKDVDANTMASLDIVPGCEEDAEALVCKLDGDTLQVRDQHLNDTTILPISKTVQIGENPEIGLMQGFLTLPYSVLDAKNYWLSNYYDLNTTLGAVRNYLGVRTLIYDPSQSKGLNGTSDAHVGIDFEGPIGLIVTSSMSGFVNGIYNGNSLIVITGQKNTVSSKNTIAPGHLKTSLLEIGDFVYAGQIIGINGMTNTSHPHIHFGFNTNQEQLNGVDSGIDPFMDLVETNPHFEIVNSGGKYDLSKTLIGSPGYWTVVNLPIFCMGYSP